MEICFVMSLSARYYSWGLLCVVIKEIIIFRCNLQYLGEDFSLLKASHDFDNVILLSGFATKIGKQEPLKESFKLFNIET